MKGISCPSPLKRQIALVDALCCCVVDLGGRSQTAQSKFAGRLGDFLSTIFLNLV